MRTIVARLLGLALVAGGASALVTGTTSPAQAETVATRYALSASGYGTKVKGGSAPAGSGKTAFAWLGCTNRAGIDKRNHLAAATVPDLGDLTGARTRVWTTGNGGVVSSWSRHTITSLTLGEGSPAGTLTISGLVSESRAWHDGKGFHASGRTDIAGILLTPPTGDPVPVDVPLPGQPVVVPGLATLRFAPVTTRTGRYGAAAATDALVIELEATGTVARVARSRAMIGGGITQGLFRGRSFATRVSAVDDNVTSGPNLLLPMPCQGTHGKVQERSLARVRLADQVVVAGLEDTQMGDQDAGRAVGWERSRVARVNVGAGQLVVTGIVGRARVELADGRLVKSSRGTSIGTVLVDGEEHAFPDTGVLEIPGVARLEGSVVRRSRSGLRVTALRITLLDGTGAVIDLGNADLKIVRSGL